MTSASDGKWRPFNCFFSQVGLRTYQHPYITVCEGLAGVKLQCMDSGVAGGGKGTNGAAAPQRQSPRGDKNEYFKFKKKISALKIFKNIETVKRKFECTVDRAS